MGSLSRISISLAVRYDIGGYSLLPDFNALTPVKTGTTANFDLGIRRTEVNDSFAIVWEGYINIPTSGTYTFETIADDGSKLYFNSLYKSNGVALVDNDGTHPPQTATGTIDVAVPGRYPITITYMENYGGETMQVYWSGPGIPRQLIPDVAFTEGAGNLAPVANAGVDKTISLPVNSTTLDGSGTDTDGTITTYAWSQVSGPNTATFSSNITAVPTVSGLIEGSYVFSLIVTDNGTAASAADLVTVNISASLPNTPVYRINAGGTQVTNSIGTFAADGFYSPTPGDIASNSAPIAGTTDDAMYQTVRYGSTGILNYAFPLANGQYTVKLHFAEIYFNANGSRVFDVSVESARVLDNYDIFKKAGANSAVIENIITNVTDGVLSINFSSLAADGGTNSPMVSAIEILRSSGNQAPFANAGEDKNVTLPASSTTLDGSGTDADGTISSYAWSQVSGPNTAAFNSRLLAVPTVSYLMGGIYVFSLIVTDNATAASVADQVTVTVADGSSNTPVYRINSGGTQVSNSFGTFTADAFYSPTTGDIASNNTPITNTTDDAMYQTVRYGGTGTLNYAFPVSNGQYIVKLHFAEIYFNARGNRVFDVSIENTRVLDNYDIFGAAGANMAVYEERTTTVTDGVLNIYFTSLAADGGTNSPMVSAIEIIRISGNAPPLANAGADKAITLPVNSTTLDGSGIDADGTIASYAWTQGSGPSTATFSSKLVAVPTISNLVAGQYIFSFTVTDNQQTASNPDYVIVVVHPTGGGPVYRINSGGGQASYATLGLFAADAYYSPTPGNVASTGDGISGTNDDHLYQSVRYGATGTLNYNFPVANGQYTVILHYAEMYFNNVGNRVFDVTMESTKVLDNYDIFKKVGANAATTETASLNVTDGTLNIFFSSLAADGGVNSPMVSAIEIIKVSDARTMGTGMGTVNTLSTTTNEFVSSLTSVNGTEAGVAGLSAKVTRAYPNPFSENVKIQYSSLTAASKVMVGIYDVAGRVVQLQQFGNTTAGVNTLSINLNSQMMPGVYLVRLEVDGKPVKMWKMVKQKK